MMTHNLTKVHREFPRFGGHGLIRSRRSWLVQ